MNFKLLTMIILIGFSQTSFSNEYDQSEEVGVLGDSNGYCYNLGTTCFTHQTKEECPSACRWIPFTPKPGKCMSFPGTLCHLKQTQQECLGSGCSWL